VHERDLMELAFADATVLDRPVAEVMSPPLPTVGSGEPVEVAVQQLDAASAILVVDAGHPVGILTRSDVLSFLAS
jgi:cystathionine beta-synthase